MKMGGTARTASDCLKWMQVTSHHPRLICLGILSPKIIRKEGYRSSFDAVILYPGRKGFIPSILYNSFFYIFTQKTWLSR